MERYGESFSQMRLSYCVEESPLGTAGCVRKAWNGDEVLVISGDAVCDFDLRSAYNYHKTKNADVTIVIKISKRSERVRTCACGRKRAY